MLKDRKYFVTLGFFVNISFLMSPKSGAKRPVGPDLGPILIMNHFQGPYGNRYGRSFEIAQKVIDGDL